MNQCPLPVEADQGRGVSGLLWCGRLAVVSGEGWPGQQLGLLRASWPHRCLDALQVWAWSTYSSRPHALITGWIHRLAWKQRSSWGKWHQRSMGVICFKRSWAGCQVSHLRKHWPLSQTNKKKQTKNHQKKTNHQEKANVASRAGEERFYVPGSPLAGLWEREHSAAVESAMGLIFQLQSCFRMKTWKGASSLSCLFFVLIQTDQTWGLSLLWLSVPLQQTDGAGAFLQALYRKCMSMPVYAHSGKEN